ncbi:penicillin acylase family protein [Haematobacter genomosp. 1]|uniref:Penicillin acylase n=1 Tax=Haematobacter genomosp. 1 TaxID=366618 RepID=A0A212A672_9RHOB|nr:penicillin acylase family protein [Haematobacter genomosp. 1]OWJ74335.1 penicillin acylase [Haematobacter genomosp. 1]
MPEDTTHRLSGLTGEVEIRIDRWGIAHIRAGTQDDLFFAQGWNAARDRLWQIDLARKRGLGLLAGDFGPGYLEQDRASRLLLYRGDMAAEWAAYGPDAEAICTAFAAGINSYVDGVLAGDLPLPPEFALLGNAPSRWKAEDVVRVRSHSLTRNATSEVLRARVMALAGVEKGARLDLLRKDLEPRVVPEPAVDLSLISARVIRDFLLGVSPVSFSPERLTATLPEAPLWTQPTPLGEIDRIASAEGSNNWAISGARTATGRPILCLDPHRTHTLPSVRYIVHLTMPGFDAIGAGEAMVPGISMGHNGTAAFGLTIYGHDQEDLCVHDLHPDDPLLYRYGDGWERMRCVEEDIPVRGHDPQKVTLHFTRHGPVLHADGSRAYALRTVWTEPGTAPYMASLAVMRARSHRDYVAALRGWGCPSVNHIFADTQGDIVWKPSGAAPVRDGWEGLLPVPGDGSHEWRGLASPDDGPVEVNPPRGFIATANAMNVPKDWQGVWPGYEWLDSSRHDRLNGALAENDRVTLDDCAAMQTDTTALSALQAVRALGTAQGPVMSPRVAALLDGFDGDLRAGSGAAALVELWLSRHLGPAIAREEGAPEAVLPLLAPYDTPSLVRWLEEVRPLPDAVAASLERAWDDCAALMGEDPARWRWGDIHRLTLRHPLHRLAPEEWSFAPLPLGGSNASPNYAAYRAGDLEVTTGPSVRMLIDVGSWDESRFVNTPGQSGVPGSAHYGDLQADWHTGRYHPLLYTPQAIAAETEARIVLSP